MANIFIDLFNMSITASYLVLAVLLVRLLLKKAPKWISCLLWALVGIRLVCPFSIESALSLVPSSQTIAVNDTSVGRPFTIQSGVPAVDVNINEFVSDKYYEGVTVPHNSFANMTTIFAIIWILGLVAMLLYGFISYIRLHKRVGASLLFKDNIYYCDNIDTPFILGFFKPKIYVPSGLSEEQINYIAMHEKAHLKRKDHLWKPLGFILLSIYWFNPVIWVAYIFLCRDIENACDEKVIKNMPDTEKKGYSETLVCCSVKRRMIMACPLAFGEVGVKQRIKSILNYKKPAFWIIIVAVIIIIVVSVCFLTNPDGNSSSIGIIGGADGPTSIIVSGENDTVDKILSEDGYKIISAEEKKVSIDLTSNMFKDRMFEKNGTQWFRYRDPVGDYTEVRLKKVVSQDDVFEFHYTVNYKEIPEKGTVCVLDDNQFDEEFELSDDIAVSDAFGQISDDRVYRTNFISRNSKSEFTFQVPKKWFESRRNNKIVISFYVLELEFVKNGYKDEKSDENYIYATDKTGDFYSVKGNYYYAVIDKTMEYHTTGLYYSEPDGNKRLVCVLGGVFTDCVVAENTFYYIQHDLKLYAVDLKEDAQPRVVAESLYTPEENYSIEKIVCADTKYIYCKGKQYGVRSDYPDWNEVYLKISPMTNEYYMISEGDIPVDEAQFDSVLANIKSTLNVDYHNVYVKNYRVRYTKSGRLESAIFNVWVPSGGDDKSGTVGNVLITEDCNASFNVINEDVSLVDFNYNNKELLTIYEVIKKAEEAISETRSDTGKNTEDDFYVFESEGSYNFFMGISETDKPAGNNDDSPKLNSVDDESLPHTTARVDYFTPEGDRVIEYVGG